VARGAETRVTASFACIWPDWPILTGDGDIGGNRVPSVPEHTVILGAYATAPLTPELTVLIRPDCVSNSKRYTSASNLSWIGNDKTLNFRMGVRSERWTLTGYVRNLPDELDPRLFSLNPKRGRDLGVELQYRF
jgi:outer membrane receptor protein involved in Fe transport